MRMFVLVLATIWFQPFFHLRTDEKSSSILIKLARFLNPGEYMMFAGLIALACVAAEAAVAQGVDHTLIAMASTVTTGMAR